MPVPHVPSVLFQTDEGERHRAQPGDLLGRGARCAIPFEDPRISEAHAMVSLRAGGFWLLGLRGTVWQGHRWGHEVGLEAGKRVLIADDVGLTVLDIDLPSLILALEGIGDRPMPLTHATLSLFAEPLQVASGFRGSAEAWIWASDGHWMVRESSGAIRVLEIGEPVQVGKYRLDVVGVPLEAGQAHRTVRQRSVHPPLTIEIGVSNTVIVSNGEELSLVGRSHDLLRTTAELTTETGAPVHWTAVASRIWRANPTAENWYRNRARLAARLKSAGLPSDLVAMDQGLVSLRLRPGTDRLSFDP